MITILLPISRRDFLRPVFNSLAELKKPTDSELLIITDGDIALQRAVDKRLDSLRFSGIEVINFGDEPGEDIDSRRYRISEIHNKAKNHVPKDCEYVMLLEDDTTYPPDALLKMLDVIGGKVAFVQGVELSRHSHPYVGGWRVDHGILENPMKIKSIMPKWVGNPIKGEFNEIIEPVDAGGFYCALVKAELYKQHTFEPFDKVGKNGLSCDVNFGLWLRRQGYQCLTDWSIQCDHIGSKGSVNLGNKKPIQVVFEKRRGKWSSRVEV